MNSARTIKKALIGTVALGFILFAAASSTVAQQTDEQGDNHDRDARSQDPQAKPSSRWQWSLTIRNRSGFRLDEPRVFQMSRSSVDAKVILRFGGPWRLTAEGLAHYDPIHRLGFPPRPWFDPRQFLIDGKIKGVSVSLGLQQIVWGQADGLRVLDVINPQDYREFIFEDFLDSRRPLWAVRADLPIEKGSLQIVWVPFFASGRLPVAENEFGLGPSFGLGLILSAIGGQIPPELGFHALPTRRPSCRLSSSQFGARYSRSVGRWDLTANTFYGWEDIPTPYFAGLDTGTTAAGPRLLIDPSHDRKVIFGGTAATNFGPLVLRLEAGWSTRKSAAVTTFPPRTGFEQHGQFSSVVGLDYSPNSWLWLSGQYFLQLTSAPQHLLVFPRYDHLASAYVRTNFFRETLRPELFLLTGLNQRQYLIRPRLTRTFGDHWSLGFGVDLLGGRPINPFGYFSSRDRAVLELKWLK